MQMEIKILCQSLQPAKLQYTMPKKYLNIKDLYVKVPFKECRIQFIIKRREKDNSSLKSQMDFYPKPISHKIDQRLEVIYSQRHINALGLYLIAINSNNRVVNIGSINLCLTDNFNDKKQYLKGVAEQNGFIIFSMTDQLFKDNSNVVHYQLTESSKSIGSDRNANLQEIDDSYNCLKKEKKGQNLQLNKEEDELQQYFENQEKINQLKSPSCDNLPNPMQQQMNLQLLSKGKIEYQTKQQHFAEVSITPAMQRSEYANNFEAEAEKKQQQKEFIILMLNHKLKNAQYRQILMQNQIFMLHQQNRINALRKICCSK